MLKIRLARIGKKKQPAYKIVVAEHSNAAKKKYTESVGSFNPSVTPSELKVDAERVDYWISKGAQPTERVAKLIQEAKA